MKKLLKTVCLILTVTMFFPVVTQARNEDFQTNDLNGADLKDFEQLLKKFRILRISIRNIQMKKLKKLWIIKN